MMIQGFQDNRKFIINDPRLLEWWKIHQYCESRAVPSLEHSEYLTTLGKDLHSDVHILWTGSRVISRYITVAHGRSVAKVLRRKPLIWDNLHANDYDQKRVFMGDFSGRPVALKTEIAALLMNPSCKYELNFVPLHTFADWNASEEDAPFVEPSDAVKQAADHTNSSSQSCRDLILFLVFSKNMNASILDTNAQLSQNLSTEKRALTCLRPVAINHEISHKLSLNTKTSSQLRVRRKVDEEMKIEIEEIPFWFL
ncbi:unnamed protein product [Nippostrongylus brasiliensis]|uniref:Bifunctional protein NCOAT (inferred by orthology to a human protein) n=1 Tax=Nippostrongylus brasiliensis TaxID=27835 RepID=A0A0N4Y0T2_NIPBR|nr:unnamed protein product [Nippostrongylus brasiliensis]